MDHLLICPQCSGKLQPGSEGSERLDCQNCPLSYPLRDGVPVLVIKKDIAREAGVPPGLIHYYFTSKEDLLVAAIRYGCNQVIPMQEVPSSLTLGEAFTLVKTHLSTHRGFYRLLFEMT
jgi:uncharacterized protein YbaR (Trm112 family)